MKIEDKSYQSRYRWCEAEACACMGCANSAFRTKNLWKEWVENNPPDKERLKKPEVYVFGGVVETKVNWED